MSKTVKVILIVVGILFGLYVLTYIGLIILWFLGSNGRVV
jgi:hypothetical protein